jgi:hypothetical protein
MPLLGIVYWLVAAGFWTAVLVTKQHRIWLVILAIVFTLVPPALVYKHGMLVFVILVELFPMGLLFWLVAAGFWAAWLATNRRLSGTGL